MGNPSQSYWASPGTWDHTVLPATRHKWKRRTLTPATNLVLDLPTPVGWKAELTYKYKLPGNAPAGRRTRDPSIASQRPNHYTTELYD